MGWMANSGCNELDGFEAPHERGVCTAGSALASGASLAAGIGWGSGEKMGTGLGADMGAETLAGSGWPLPMASALGIDGLD